MGTVLSRFVARRNLKITLLWAFILSGYFASKCLGFIQAYPTAAARAKLAASFSHNTGLEILVGPARHLDTVSGYVAWNCVQFMVIMGAVWGLLLATKSLRGEEESGRWELLLSGPTTARRATAQVLSGIGLCLAVMYTILAAVTVTVGHKATVGISPSAALFFDLTILSGIVIFVLVGALASQLLPSRGRAASVAAAVFGICFGLRATGDITSAHWLLNLTPIGWIEKLQPLTTPQPIWLVPLGLLAAVLLGVTLWLAGRRDLEGSLIAERSSSPSHTALLNQPLGLAFRTSRTNIICWCLGLGLLSLFYSALTKTAVQALKTTSIKSAKVAKIIHESSLASANAYLGIIFLIMLLVLMAFAANTAIAIRRDESHGYLDNLLVRPVSRWQWLGGRLLLGALAVVVAALTVAGAAWLGVALLHLGVSVVSLLEAGLNIAAAGIFVLGAGVLAFGFWPRATSFVAYGVLVWSFLINMLNSGVHLNHWLIDSSVLNQLPLVPAAKPNWQVTAVLALLGLALALIGGSRFSRRDLETE
jgi:ABC-2 type transport system permease protein